MRPKKPFDRSIFLLAAIAALIAGGSIYAFFTFRQDAMGEILNGDRVVNALFILEKDGKPLDSYALLFYPQTNRAAVFDIPGEVGRIIRQINRVDRIDTVYTPQDPADFIAQVESLLDIDFNFYVIFTLDELADIVDLLEGVDVMINQRVAVYNTEPPVLFPSGRTLLDGDKSLLYLTYSTADDNVDTLRGRRQRFFTGFLKRLAERGSYLNKGQAAQFFHSSMETNIGVRNRAAFFDAVARLEFERLTIQTVGGEYSEISGQTLLLPSWDGSLIKEVVHQSSGLLTRMSQTPAGDRNFTVEVLNGTQVLGLAGRTADLLRSFGYDVIAVNNAETDDYAKTVIIDQSGLPDRAQDFASVIRCKNVRQTDGALQSAAQNNGADAQSAAQHYEVKADFILILGRDFNGRYTTGG
jgi:anionic cell wall polymer biosynthesis LytR-Cps2A-Psr (LCP) family protein